MCDVLYEIILWRELIMIYHHNLMSWLFLLVRLLDYKVVLSLTERTNISISFEISFVERVFLFSYMCVNIFIRIYHHDLMSWLFLLVRVLDYKVVLSLTERTDISISFEISFVERIFLFSSTCVNIFIRFVVCFFTSNT